MTYSSFEQRDKQLTLGRILVKDPRSRLVPEAEVNALLRPTLVVWVTRVVWDMDEGTICELETRCGRGSIRRSLVSEIWVVMSLWSWRTSILLIKDCFDNVKELGNISSICVKIWRVSVVEQIISSNKRITTAIQVERGHYKFDLSSSSWIAYERSLEAMQCSVWI